MNFSSLSIVNYQLSIDTADISPTEEGMLSADIVLVAYSLEPVLTE